MKQLVIVCNSLDRLDFMSKYMFKDQFNGHIFIITDDRVRSLKQDIIKRIESYENINLRESTVLGFIEDGVWSYIRGRILLDDNSNEENVDMIGDTIFAITTLGHVFFTRNNNLTMVIEDDILLFKNPINHIDKFSAGTHQGNQCTLASIHMKYIRELDSSITSNIPVKMSVGVIDDKRYVREFLGLYPSALRSHAHVIWDKRDSFIAFIRNIISNPSFIKHIRRGREKNQRIIRYGVATSFEILWSYYLYTENVSIHRIIKDQCGINTINVIPEDAIGYHYTCVPDKHIFDLLPIYMEKGRKEYLRVVKEYNLSLEDQLKFNYLPEEQKLRDNITTKFR